MARNILTIAIVFAAACSGRNGGGPVKPDNGGNGTYVPPVDGDALSQDSYSSMFEEGQAAYYIDHQDTVWLVVRVAEGSDDETLTTVVLHLLSRLTEEFDFTQDARAEVVILAYEGILEKKHNYGIKVEIANLKKLQATTLSMPDLLQTLTEVVNINLVALKPYITG